MHMRAEPHVRWELNHKNMHVPYSKRTEEQLFDPSWDIRLPEDAFDDDYGDVDEFFDVQEFRDRYQK